MRFVASLSVQSSQIIVVIAEDGTPPTRIAYGIDLAQQTAVFYKQVDDLSAFISALAEDRSGEFIEALSGTNVNQVVTFAQDIPTTPPPSPWPNAKTVIASAQAFQWDETLAQVHTDSAA